MQRELAAINGIFYQSKHLEISSAVAARNTLKMLTIAELVHYRQSQG